MDIGVIAEDESDIDTLYQLSCKIINENDFRFRKAHLGGSGNIRRKCNSWAGTLSKRGCQYLMVVHDLDENDEATLRRELESKIERQGFVESLVLLAIKELEAWLLCDKQAIKAVHNTEKLPKLPHHPEQVADPKKELGKAIKSAGGIAYVNTIHNPRLAKAIDPKLIENKCASFRPLVGFLQQACN